MPNIEMILSEGVDATGKTQLLSRATEATVAALGAPLDSVRIWISEIPAGNFAVGGLTCRGNQRPVERSGVMFVAFLIAGRTDVQKAHLIDALTDVATGVLGIERETIRVIVNDIPNTDFGIGGVTAASLGRGIGRSNR
ncbi:MAG: tautomerase family protein [Pseudomonadota bacterium]|jgi:4-oxalocrotonate tautomerase family enzyme|uniref:tautomerase family protein n=1 Tax=Burkholderiaceae TaxID=119060 RepID=UPI0010F541A3|nr:tautomerase family protein [Burkholderia sp. 4M9327F10]